MRSKFIGKILKNLLKMNKEEARDSFAGPFYGTRKPGGHAAMQVAPVFFLTLLRPSLGTLQRPLLRGSLRGFAGDLFALVAIFPGVPTVFGVQENAAASFTQAELFVVGTAMDMGFWINHPARRAGSVTEFAEWYLMPAIMFEHPGVDSRTDPVDAILNFFFPFAPRLPERLFEIVKLEEQLHLPPSPHG
jgi:hypothetical protein